MKQMAAAMTGREGELVALCDVTVDAVLLVLLLGFDQRLAAGTSLAAIVPTATVGVISYALSDSVAWIPALILAVGAVGGFLIPLAFGAPWIDDPVDAVRTSLMAFTLFYVLCLATTWAVYVRRTSVAEVAGLADARV